MWPYGGKHCPARAYMPSKPDKFGIKAWALNDHHTGYLYDFWPYGGQGDRFPHDDDALCAKWGHGERIILWHTRDLERDSVLFTDSHFSSPLVKLHIKDTRGIYSCGTCDPFRANYPWQELH